MKWIKASERLPEFTNAPEDFGVVFRNKKQVKTFTVYPTYTRNIPALLQNDLVGWEWLDESESPSGETLEAADGLKEIFGAIVKHSKKCRPEESGHGVVIALAQQGIEALQQTGKPSVDTLRVQQNKQLHYWKQRCEAAEAFIEFSPIDPDVNGLQIAAHKKWLSLKQDK